MRLYTFRNDKQGEDTIVNLEQITFVEFLPVPSSDEMASLEIHFVGGGQFVNLILPQSEAKAFITALSSSKK